jgi:V-type H+-transporting ATPase subunit a
MGERVEIPNGDYHGTLREYSQRIQEMGRVMDDTRSEMRKYLETINVIEGSHVSALMVQRWFVLREKELYSTLNKLKFGERFLVGLYWIPVSKIKTLRDFQENTRLEMLQMTRRSTHGVIPPTSFKLNEFTSAFQQITSTYGIPDYKEVNPSVFGCVTFPFLFGVMFGDMCHGFILLLIGILMCLFAEPLKKTALGGAIAARYLVLLMGIFAFYCGICYNDFTSIPVEAGSCYEVRGTEVTKDPDCVYAIGIDPIWYRSENELNFINNLKMKTSVIFGVA